MYNIKSIYIPPSLPHLRLHRLALLIDQALLRLHRALSNARKNNPANTLLQQLNRHTGLLLHGLRIGRLDLAPPLPLPAILLPKHALKHTRNLRLILLQIVHHRIWPRIKRVRRNDLARLRVDGLNDLDRRTAHVVEVEDGRVRVEAGSVEAIAIHHGDLAEGLEVALLDRLLHLLHAAGHRLGGARRKQRGGGHRRLHARRGGDALLRGADDQDDGAHVGPVRGGGDLEGDRVAAVRGRALLPPDVPAEQRAAGGSGALARNAAEVRGGRGELVEVCDCADEGGEAGG